MRFAADKMVGRLARWLRIIGQDVVYGPHLTGTTLMQVARREGRMILTRDTRLVRRRNVPPHLFIHSDHFREQFRQVVAAFDLSRPSAIMTRCLDCNEELRETDRSTVRQRVPPYVWATQDRFMTCRRCHRVFWGATHMERMRAELRRLGVTPPGETP
jgi:uncharacterized protein with PIN domain